MATERQKDQLLASMALGLNETGLDKDKTQVFLKDPEGWARFTQFIAQYERRKYPRIILAGVPKLVTFPSWSGGRILSGEMRCPMNVDFESIVATAKLHPLQTYEDQVGHKILALLVSSYKVDEDVDGTVYGVTAQDLIHTQFGLAELMYVQSKWDSLPPEFKEWVKDKPVLYGWKDVVRDAEHSCLRVPCLFYNGVSCDLHWYKLGVLYK